MPTADSARPSERQTITAANDNVGSVRVLAKCGFVIVDQERGYANARGEEIDELVLKLTS